ncbi:MAG: hypothetical protein J5I99_09015 [Verrucomicrobia bacterium]|nr:hypothetical protein [Verrucomicrobiota bacterium]
MANKWHLIVPKGEFPHPAGVVQVIDDMAVSAMAAAFDPQRKVLIDFDHYSELTNAQRAKVREAGIQLPSEAVGWVTAVKASERGLLAQIETTPLGEKKLANKEYRFLSPVWRREDCARIGGDRVRPLVLSKIGLTNEPNIKAIPELVANRGTERLIGPLVDFLANSEQALISGGNVMDYRAKLIVALGLPADATDDAIWAGVEAMKAKADRTSALENRATTATNELATMRTRAEAAEAKLAAADRAALAGRVTAALKEYETVITNRADVEAALTKDFDGTVKVLKALKIDALPNRRDGNLPDEDNSDFTSKVKAQTEAVVAYCNRNPGTSRTQAYSILLAQGHEAFK